MSDKFADSMRLRFHYSTEKDCRLQIAHGVWGGINPHGEIEMNFYSESDAIPEMTEQIASTSGFVGEETEIGGHEPRRINRVIHSRILINLENACALADWLQNRIEELENAEFGDDAYPDSPKIAQ